MLVSKRRVLEFGRGNIMTKASENDVSLRNVKQFEPEIYVSNDWRHEASVIISRYDDILYKGKVVGGVSYTTSYDSVMDDEYDDYDSDNKEDYIDTDFDYTNKGDKRWCHIDRLDIDDQWQNIGIGTAILIKYFRGASLSPDNKDAQTLYARIGSQYTGNNDGILNTDVGYGVYEID